MDNVFVLSYKTAIDKNLEYLKAHNYIERVGSKKTGYWKVIK